MREVRFACLILIAAGGCSSTPAVDAAMPVDAATASDGSIAGDGAALDLSALDATAVTPPDQAVETSGDLASPDQAVPTADVAMLASDLAAGDAEAQPGDLAMTPDSAPDQVVPPVDQARSDTAMLAVDSAGPHDLVMACGDIATDPDNCGKCGQKCMDLPNATRGCSQNLCTVASCNKGFLDCDGQASDGCEVNSIGDNQNCGTCFTACTPTNGVGACISSMCTVDSCKQGFADCNKKYMDGCEINTGTDNANCGACGKTCDNGSFCRNGLCATIFVDSMLLNAAQCVTINQWVGTPDQRWNVCFRLSKDGTGIPTFHQKCDNRGPTVTVANLGNGARLMGAYNSQPWNSKNAWYGDANSFIFSLTNNFKHLYFQSQYIVYGGATYAPTWGGGNDFSLGVGPDIGQNQMCNLGYSYQCRVGAYLSDQCRSDLCGAFIPQITDVEVWVKDGN